jgi:branched-chain amino acid transport system permease protein
MGFAGRKGGDIGSASVQSVPGGKMRGTAKFAGRTCKLFFFITLFLVPVFVRNQFILDTFILIFLWAALGGAWNIVGGYAGQLSLGHAVFYGIGAYTTSILFINAGISPWFGLILGGLISTFLALFIGAISIRLKGPFFALATIAIIEVAHISAINLRTLTKGAEGLSIPFRPGIQYLMFSERWMYVYAALILMMIVYVTTVCLERSRLGYHLVALREDSDAAESVGVPTLKAKLIAFCISAFLTSLCGSFYALYINYIDPYNTFSAGLSVEIALIAIIGGMGTPIGPILGSFLLTPLGQLLRAWMGGGQAGLYMLIYGSILIVVVIFLPHGIVKEFRQRVRRHIKQ